MTPETIEIVKMVSGGLSFLAYVLYMLSMIFGSTRPSRSSWWILSVVWTITLMSSVALADGANFGEKWLAVEGSWITLSYIAGSLGIALLSIRWHKRGKWEPLDYLCAVFAGIAVVFYVGIEIYAATYGGGLGAQVIKGLLMASLATSLLADFFGIIPTVQNAWKYPKKEDAFAWGLEFVASLMTLSIVREWNFSFDGISGFSVPLYLMVMNGIITVVIFSRRRFRS